GFGTCRLVSDDWDAVLRASVSADDLPHLEAIGSSCDDVASVNVVSSSTGSFSTGATSASLTGSGTGSGLTGCSFDFLAALVTSRSTFCRGRHQPNQPRGSSVIDGSTTG